MKKFIIIALLTVLITGGVLYFALFQTGANQSITKNVETSVRSHNAYNLELASNSTVFTPNQPTEITYRITDSSGTIIKDFLAENDEIMHFFLVRDDLENFQQLQPDFDKASGTFSVNTIFPTKGIYRLYADFTPAGGQQAPGLGVVTTADVNVGNVTKKTPTHLVPTEWNVQTSNGYSAIYRFPSVVEANVPTPFTLSIEKDGQPITDLEDYLGARAYATVFESKTLRFEHVSANNTGGDIQPENGSPLLTFTYRFPKPGLYKVFTQFQHQGQVITTDYVIKVD